MENFITIRLLEIKLSFHNKADIEKWLSRGSHKPVPIWEGVFDSLVSHLNKEKQKGEYMNVEKLLGALGSDSAQVAKNLLRFNAKGTKGSRASCPIANYLKKMGAKKVSVDSVAATGSFTDPLGKVRSFKVGLSGCCSKFVKEFDGGAHRGLEG